MAKQISVKKNLKNSVQAAALGYDAEVDDAPRVLAKGSGKTAERIIALAKEHNIPIFEDAVLTEALSLLDIDQQIPEELYAVVAEILVYVYRIQNKLSEEGTATP